MDLLVTVDRNYLHPLAVMLKSFACNNEGSHIVYILNRELTPDDVDALADAICEPRLQLINHPVRQPLVNEAPTTGRYPIEIYDRIFAARYLPDSLDRVLYLDPDLVVLKPLDALWNLNLGAYWFAAASHVKKFGEVFNAVRLDAEKIGPYINSGVMLMNLELLRRYQEVGPVLVYVKEHEHSLVLPDQDIISALYGEHIMSIDPYIYNMTDRMLMAQQLLPDSQINIEWVENNSRIVHYLGRSKPWKKNYQGRLGYLYRRYEAMLKQNETHDD